MSLKRSLNLIVLLAAGLLVHADVLAQSEKDTQSIAVDLTVRDDQFLGLKLGMSMEQATAAGVKYMVQKPAAGYGPFFEVGRTPVEVPGTYRRTLYFKEDYGLYRVRYAVSSSDGGKLSADGVRSLFGSIVKKFAEDNPHAKVVKRVVADVNGARLDTLQACPKGSSAMRARLNNLTVDQIRELLTQLGSRIGESYSDSAMMLMMHCGAMPSPLLEVAVSGDVHVIIAQDFEDIEGSGPSVVIVFFNSAIANMMKRGSQ